MIVVISPAKSLDFKSPLPVEDSTPPPFPEQTERLVSALSRMSKPKLQSIMPVSDSLIALNHARYHDFFAQEERPAIRAFSGDVYIGMEAGSLDEPALIHAQRHLRILSGLYGLLSPFDRIRPHRLEMGTRWAPRHKKLTDYWGDRIARALADSIIESGAGTLLNLASQEYWASVEPYRHLIPVSIIDVDFRQDGPDGPRFSSFAAKRARGMMARYVMEHHISDPAALEAFDSDGYRFAGREGNSLRFIRR